ncbi:MAG: adenine phosphoribosyltransferase [Flammeovirgaceae bacterium]|nr:MAG: adenine phosphoribosyltransferase [Flammeovirgaceae bacterium]
MNFDRNLSQQLREAIRDIPDYPKPGIVFKDITPVLTDPELITQVIDALVRHARTFNVDAIVAIEARGFIFGGMLAHALNRPFVPVRKVGKLPYRTISRDYDLEYGSATVEMHEDAILKDWNVLVHDDLLATGGTAAAAGRLVQQAGGRVAGFSFLINLSFLPGEKKLVSEFGINPYCLVSF